MFDERPSRLVGAECGMGTLGGTLKNTLCLTQRREGAKVEEKVPSSGRAAGTRGIACEAAGDCCLRRNTAVLVCAGKTAATVFSAVFVTIVRQRLRSYSIPLPFPRPGALPEGGWTRLCRFRKPLLSRSERRLLRRTSERRHSEAQPPKTGPGTHSTLRSGTDARPAAAHH
jgi:hypothetical protein